MDATASDSLLQNAVVNLELKNTINFHFTISEHFVELLSLNCSAGEPVQQNTSLALWVVHSVVDKSDNKLIRYQLACFHDIIGLFSERSACFDSITEHISSCQVAKTQ